MPMPDLPTGGRREVRAAALAVRAAKRRDRARLLAAAAVTLVIGVVGGAALSSAVQQQGPTSNQAAVQVDLDYASGYLAKHDSAKARQYIERASKAMLGKALAPLATEASTASEAAAIDVLRQELAVQMERATQAGGAERQAQQSFGFDGTHCARPTCQVAPQARPATTTTATSTYR